MGKPTIGIESVIAQWFSRSPHARCILDHKGAILASSAAATRVLRHSEVLAEQSGRFVVQNTIAQKRLHAALSSARRQLVLTDGPEHPRPGVLLVEPINGSGCACVTIWRPKRPSLRLFLPLVERYRLSPSQARVAAELVAGRSLQEIARKLDISIETVRSHLKAIFDKTGARTQSGLVALFLRFINM